MHSMTVYTLLSPNNCFMYPHGVSNSTHSAIFLSNVSQIKQINVAINILYFSFASVFFFLNVQTLHCVTPNVDKCVSYKEFLAA